MVQPGILFFIVHAEGAYQDALIDGARAALLPTGRYHFAGDPVTLAAPLPDPLLALLRAGQHVVATGPGESVSGLAVRVPRMVVVAATSLAEVPPGVTVIPLANDGTREAGIERLVSALDAAGSRFRLRRVPVDTGRRHTAFLPRDSRVVAAADYLGPGRIDVTDGDHRLAAEVALVEPGAWLKPEEIGLSAAAFDAFARPEATEVSIRRTRSPGSRDALRRKLRDAVLTEAEYDRVLGDIIAGHYTDGEVAGFLVAANRALTDAEVLSIARVRARYAKRITWNEPIVVDKHSMGGIPGSRITLIVVPLVAAHGMIMPKTSSRAITSAAGTADAMETLARVDLSMEEVAQVVARAHACIAWNGRLSHSTLDEVMNAITRPLGLDTNRWSVASILSKKVAAGSTHVVVDLPYGPRARLTTRAEAEQLGRLFESVGAGLGLVVSAIATDGRNPIGRGIGPALEVRDVLLVLDNHPDAPADLREKALTFAARVIAWDPAVANAAEARRRAEVLLASGAARAALDAIVDAQGRWPEPAQPATLTHVVRAPRAGQITSVDGFVIAGIARRAGAPLDKGAGVDLRVRIGERIRAGDPLFTVHASTAPDLAAAVALAADAPAFGLDGAPQ
jgi:thymidine phosphorylase